MDTTTPDNSPRPFDPNERTYKQSMMCKSLFGWWAPRECKKSIASALIDAGFDERKRMIAFGDDCGSLTISPEMKAQLQALDNAYINKWLEDGCPVLKSQYAGSGKPSTRKPKPSTPKPEPKPAPTAPTTAGDADLDEADLLKLVEIVNVLKLSKRKIAIVATLLDVK